MLNRGQKGQSSLRELLQPLVEGVLKDKNLSINTNPLEVYKAWINQMESETGEARYRYRMNTENPEKLQKTHSSGVFLEHIQCRD